MKKRLLSTVFFLSLSSLAHGGVFFSDGFESGDLKFVDPVSNAKWAGSNAGSGDSVVVSSERSRTGSKSLKFLFKGDSLLSDDAFAEQRFNLGSNRNEVFIRYYIYFPTNYVIRNDPNGPENTKLLRLWGSDYTNDGNKVGMSIDSSMTAYYEAKIAGYPLQNSCSGGMGQASTEGSQWELTSGHLGRWISFEFHIKKDSGVGDGIFRMYVDGVLVNDQSNLSWIGAPCSPGYFLNGYLMGWSNSGFTKDTAVYVDDVVFSTSYIGPDGGVTAPVSVSPPSNLIIK